MDLFKILSNSVFGKIIDDDKKRKMYFHLSSNCYS